MPPVFNEAAKEFRDTVVSAKVDIFKETPLARDFGVRTIPTIVFLRGRIEVERFEGAISERTLRWYFERVMAPPAVTAADEPFAEPMTRDAALHLDSEPVPQPEPATRRGFISLFRK
ncbi:MAG TPA: thioredoxin family protein [Dehalococcoidia bacterium]|jgi:thioredoxin-like negative regulator of GroEL|nr:thioredoxin family protein [Dehalococcoidia bacterium]